MRIRTIKPEFWMHEGMAGCAEFSRLLAIGLLNLADDEGYFMAHPALIRGSLFPFDDDSTKIRRGLDELSRIRFLEVKADQQGRPVGRIVNFTRHQKVDRARSSSIKELCEFDDDSTNPRRGLAVGMEWNGKGMEGNGSLAESADSAVELSQIEIPEKEPEPASPGKPEVVPKNPKPRLPDLCFEELVKLQGSSLQSLTKSERGRLNKALAEIRSACPALTPALLSRRAEAYRAAMPGATFTATALAAHWSRLAGSGTADLPVKNLTGAARHFDPEVAGAAPDGWESAFDDLYDITPKGEWHTQQPYVRDAITSHLQEISHAV